jgi:outer membrane receptor protein involved in Fe transport
MPLNLRLGLSHTLGGWQQTLEWQVVRAKTECLGRAQRDPHPAYALLNWHASWQMDDRLRLELGVDNLLDRRYRQPTGGAYLGQGSSMALTGIPGVWRCLARPAPSWWAPASRSERRRNAQGLSMFRIPAPSRPCCWPRA